MRYKETNELMDRLEDAIRELRVKATRTVPASQCRLCGAGYGRHFTDCPVESIPGIFSDLKNEIWDGNPPKGDWR